MRLTLPEAATFERWLTRALAVGLVAAPLGALACALLISLGYDESWFLIDIRNLVERRIFGGDEMAPSWTTGGVYTLVVTLLSAASGGEVWVVRLFSVFCLGGLLALLYRWGSQLFDGPVAGLLMASALLAVPGSLTLGGLAYGAVPAFLLVVSAAVLWSRAPVGSRTRWVGTGLLLGAAAATRWNCVVALPALVGAAVLAPERRAGEARTALAAAVLGGVVFAAALGGLVAISDLSLDIDGANYGAAGGNDALFDYPRLLNKWVIAENFMPVPLLVLVSGAWFWLRRRVADAPRGLDLLVIFAWLQWFAWIARSPIPHLRYVWPGLAGFAVLAGVALAALHAHGRRQDDSALRLVALSAGLACLVTGYAAGLRSVVHGEGDLLSMEWSNEVARSPHYRRFDHARHQREMSRHLEQVVAPDEVVMVLGSSLPNGYLSRRRLYRASWFVNNGWWETPERLPKRILVTPWIGSYERLRDSGRRWIEDNCTLEARYGAWLLYRVEGAYPSDPKPFKGYIGATPPPLSS